MQCKWCAQVLDKKTKALAKLKHLEGGRDCVSGRLACCRLLAIRLPRVTCTGLKFASVEQSINVINYVIMNLTLRIKTKQLGCESTSGKGCEKCLYLGNNKKQKNDIFHQLWAESFVQNQAGHQFHCSLSFSGYGLLISSSLDLTLGLIFVLVKLLFNCKYEPVIQVFSFKWTRLCLV